MYGFLFKICKDEGRVFCDWEKVGAAFLCSTTFYGKDVLAYMFEKQCA